MITDYKVFTLEEIQGPPEKPFLEKLKKNLKILDLEEAQGLTTEQVRIRLEQDPKWSHCGGTRYFITMRFERPWIMKMITIDLKYLDRALHVMALCGGKSPQELLRELNPRMRTGWPSDEDLDRSCFWLVQVGMNPSVMCRFQHLSGGVFVRAECSDVVVADRQTPIRCWPCNPDGDKLTWPAK